MHRSKACAQAHEMKAKMEDMILHDKDVTIKEMMEFNAVYDFCRNMARGSVYIENAHDSHEMKKTDHKETHRITKEMANKWLASMENDDGSTGAHWTIQETNKVAELCNVKFEHIKDYEWNVVMNMMYSDHYHTAKSCNKQSDVVFFGSLAKEFLFDKDGKAPSERLYFFWKDVVKH